MPSTTETPYLAVLGLGIAVVVYVLQEFKVNISRWLLVPLGAVGIALIVYGSSPYVKTASPWIWVLVILGVAIYVLLWNRRRVLTTMHRLKWRLPVQWPVTFTNKPGPSSVIAESSPIPIVPALGYEQIARNVGFVDFAKALAFHLSSKNCNGLAYTFSLRTLLEKIRGVPSVRTLVDNDDIYLMLIHVIENKFSDLLGKANELKATAEAMEATKLVDADIALICKDIGEVVDDYGRLLDGVVQVIKGFQARKDEVNPLGPIPPSPPLASLISPQTHKDHAELFRLLDDLRSHTPDDYRPLLPAIGRFASLPT